jgi:prolyl-tRNA synthetase
MYAHAIHNVSSGLTRTSRETVEDQTSKNAQLFTRAGYVHRAAAGVYTLMPLGVRVVGRIESIIRDEMNALGAYEAIAALLQPREVWERTGRWDLIDVLYQLRSRHGAEYGLAATAEEGIIDAFSRSIRSYRDLPLGVYQISTKFRDEHRARSGLLRGREFRMKDLYSFHLSTAEQDAYYEEVCAAYMRIFARCGIGEKTKRTYASGGVFSKFSDEFQLIDEAGEDTIYVTEDGSVAINKEIVENAEVLAGIFGSSVPKLVEHRAIEVGNTFKLGTRYTDAFGISAHDATGSATPIHMACYGIGSTRVMAAVAEVYSDDAGLVWPRQLAPYDVYVVVLSRDAETVESIRAVCRQERISALIDDRAEVRAGEKFADADLLGIPVRVVVGGRGRKSGEIGVKRRASSDEGELSIDVGQLVSYLDG